MEGAKEGPTKAAAVNLAQDQSLGRSSGRTAYPCDIARGRARGRKEAQALWAENKGGVAKVPDELGPILVVEYFPSIVTLVALLHGLLMIFIVAAVAMVRITTDAASRTPTVRFF